MNEIRYFPEKPNSKYNYLKMFIAIIAILFFMHLSLDFKSNHSWNHWPIEMVLGIMGILYFSLRKLTTEVCFDFENRKLEISYLTLLKGNNKLNIEFENVDFELKKKMYRSIEDWVLYVYEGENIKYRIEKLKDNFTKENLEKISNQNLD